MPLRRQLLYYQLLKHSGRGTLCGDILDQAVDRLCSAPTAGLASVSVRVQLDGLLQTAKELEVLSVPEVAQLCMQVRYAIENHGDAGYTDVLIGRALEAAGVAFAITNFSEKYKPYMESRLYRTQGLKHLLTHYGDQVLKDISSYIHAFEVLFIHRVLDLHATLQALMAMKRLLPDVYRVFTKRRKAYLCPEKAILSLRTHSLSLDDAEEGGETPTIPKVLLGRRAFSVDVTAALELQGFPVPA